MQQQGFRSNQAYAEKAPPAVEIGELASATWVDNARGKWGRIEGGDKG